MDNRLDFYNDVNKFLKTITEDDTLLLISHNKKEGDLICKFIGEWQVISSLISNNESVNHKGDSKMEFNEVKRLFLNTVVNICSEDNQTLKLLLDSLSSLDYKENNT